MEPEQQHLEAHTVRDIVEHDPGQVNEAWCRKIFRQLLQSLELQYAMQMPHRAITADTVAFHDNGEPLLLPSIVSDPEPEVGGDLTALAKLIHYAITQELVPTGPLRGRALEGYSDALIDAVDRCMDPDPAVRPHSIEELRDILGIVTLSSIPVAPMPPLQASSPDPSAPDVAAPGIATAEVATPEVATAEVAPPDGTAPAAAAIPPRVEKQPQPVPQPGRRSRWPLVAGIILLAAFVLAGLALLHNGGSFDHAARTLPQNGEDAPPPTTPAVPPAPPAPADAAPGAPIDAGTVPPADAALPGAAPIQPLPQGAAVAAPADATTVYRLQIQPWGTVYVDEVDRGVSPPIKRLLLAPGRHTIRVSNPNFQDHVLEVDTAAGPGRIEVDFREKDQ